MTAAISRFFPVLTLAVLAYGLLGAGAAYAGTDVSAIARNIDTSARSLPGLLAAAAYSLGLLLGVLAILKIKAHVETPNQVPLREGVIRFIAGGALFALPILYEAMAQSIDATGTAMTTGGYASSIIGALSLSNVGDFNEILHNITDSIADLPGLLASISYLLGLLFGIAGILKLRDHVDNPPQTPLKEAIIRFLVGGGLFALPAVIVAARETIDGGVGGAAGALLDTIMAEGTGFLTTSGDANTVAISAACGANMALHSLGAGSPSTIDAVICDFMAGTLGFPFFLNALSYLFGITLIVWGMLKLKDHVLNPQQTTIWEAVSRLIAGGCFMALPYIIDVARNTLANAAGTFNTNTWNGATSGSGVDEVMVRFVDSIYAPVTLFVNVFGYAAGVTLIMIGISRLMKMANEGPRAPGGLGTMVTFLTGGALLAFMPLIAAATDSMFAIDVITTNASLQYTTGMTAPEVNHVHAVISSVLKFMIVLGMISVARGIFIIRAVAEGNSQASLMAGITHILGGALAINLGPLVNAVQTTLGLAAYGVNFT